MQCNSNAFGRDPLCALYSQEQHSLSHMCPSHITNTLKTNVQAICPALGFLPSDASTHCLQAAGANALLCDNVDPDLIHLLDQ